MTLENLAKSEFESRASCTVLAIEQKHSEQHGWGFEICAKVNVRKWDKNYFTIIRAIDFDSWVVCGFVAENEFDCIIRFKRNKECYE